MPFEKERKRLLRRLHRPHIVPGIVPGIHKAIALAHFRCKDNILKRKCFSPTMASLWVLSIAREYKLYVVTLL